MSGTEKSGATRSSAGKPGAVRRSAAERRAAAAALRAEQERRERRRRILLVAAVAAVLFVLAGAVGFAVTRGRSGPAAQPQILPAAVTGTPTAQRAVRRVADTSGIPGVLAWDTGNYPGAKDTPTAVEHQHVAGPVTYTVTPPVGGPHSATWMNAGVYTRPIPSERAVHDLEHGGVWITYRPGLAAHDVTALTSFVAKQSTISESQPGEPAGQGNRYVSLSPWTSAALPAPIVISAWGHQLQVTSAGDPRLQRFVDTFRNSRRYTPEYGNAVDGIPTGIGGRPASGGSTKPNPSGTGATGVSP